MIKSGEEFYVPEKVSDGWKEKKNEDTERLRRDIYIVPRAISPLD